MHDGDGRSLALPGEHGAVEAVVEEDVCFPTSEFVALPGGWFRRLAADSPFALAAATADPRFVEPRNVTRKAV